MTDSTTTDSTTTGIDATAVIEEYFAGRVAEARAAAEKANAHLAEAEAAAEAFTARGELPPDSGALGQSWDLCVWVTSRTARIGFKDLTARGDAAFHRAEAEHAAVFGWLEDHGFEIPGPYKN
jgi:hypothetical protein